MLNRTYGDFPELDGLSKPELHAILRYMIATGRRHKVYAGLVLATKFLVWSFILICALFNPFGWPQNFLAIALVVLTALIGLRAYRHGPLRAEFTQLYSGWLLVHKNNPRWRPHGS